MHKDIKKDLSFPQYFDYTVKMSHSYRNEAQIQTQIQILDLSILSVY